MPWQTIGHDWARAMLERAAQARPSHAYLFSGPAQVGKRTLAIDFARALNCTTSGAGFPAKPCGQCRSCRLIAAGQHPDVRLVEPAPDKTDITTEQIGELLGELALKPYEGRYRFALIDPFEDTNAFSANKLLKTLEEPEAHVVFLLIALSLDAVLPTIRSRCQQITLRPLPVGLVESALRARDVEPERARLLARLSGGRIGWALSAAADEELLSRRSALLEELLAVPMLGIAERIDRAGRLAAKETVQPALDLWLSWWRDLLLVKGDCADALLNVDFVDRLQRDAAVLDLGAIERYIVAIQAARTQLDQNVNARLALEVLLLDTPAPRG